MREAYLPLLFLIMGTLHVWALEEGTAARGPLGPCESPKGDVGRCCFCSGEGFDGLRTETRKLSVGKDCRFICRHPKLDFRLQKIREGDCPTEEGETSASFVGGLPSKKP
jgi:hypothetical protein